MIFYITIAIKLLENAKRDEVILNLIVNKYNGEFVGKLAPYGYIKDPKDKHKFLIDKKCFF